MKKLVTIFLAAAFLLVMYVPVSAAEWDFYGSARVQTFWTDIDNDDPAKTDTTNLDHDLSAVARIGGTVKNGAIGGGFEYGPGVNLRKLYGTVDLGPGQFLVGQDYAPFGAGSFISSQAYNGDNGLLEFVAYTSRRPMGQFSIEGFKIALVAPTKKEESEVTLTDSNGNPLIDADTGKNYTEKTDDGDPEVLLPQVQASYTMKMEGVSLNFAGVFQTYDLDNGDGDTLTAYGAGTNIQLTMMDPLYLNFGGFYGQNTGNFGQYLGVSADISNRNDIQDVDTYGAAIVFGGNMDPIGFQIGAGYRNDDPDNAIDDTDLYAYYGQVTVPLTQSGNAFIVPEVGYYDYETKDEYYAGLKWHINF